MKRMDNNNIDQSNLAKAESPTSHLDRLCYAEMQPKPASHLWRIGGVPVG